MSNVGANEVPCGWGKDMVQRANLLGGGVLSKAATCYGRHVDQMLPTIGVYICVCVFKSTRCGEVWSALRG